MSFDVFLAAIRSPALRIVARHWNEIRPAGALPGWSSIDAVAMGPALRYIWAWRFDLELGDFVGRLAGEDIVNAFGASPKGRAMRDFFTPEVYLAFHPLHVRVMTEPAMLHGTGAVYSVLGRRFVGERICLPLAEDGRTGDAVIGATVYDLLTEAAPAVADELAVARADFYPVA
jgi:hypothetical protein